MTVNLFKTAEKVPAKSTTKPEQAVIVVPGLDPYAAVDNLINQLEKVKKSLSAKANIAEIFINTGLEKKDRPDSFKGTEGDSTATCVYSSRATSVPLTDEEVALLKKHEISFEEVTEEVDSFFINQKYLSDKTLLRKINKALNGVPNIPADFFVEQKSVTKRVITDTSIKEVFQKKKKDVIELFGIVGSISIKAVKTTKTTAALFTTAKFLLEAFKKAEETAALVKQIQGKK